MSKVVYGNGNSPDIDTMKTHQTQQDRISGFNVTERHFLFRRVRGYINQRPQGECRCHCPEVIPARSLSKYHWPFQRKRDLLYNGSISPGHLSDLLLNPESGVESPCFSQHKCVTAETAKTYKPLYSDGEDLLSLRPVGARTNGISKEDEYSASELSEQENLENPRTDILREVERNYEDQYSTTSIGEDGNEKGPRNKRNIQSDSGGRPRKRWLACPWYKKDPLKYSSCAKYKLLRIKDVKQHTYRRHMKPTIYCSACFRVFSRETERDRHTQKKTCIPRDEPEFDGLSEQQRKELNQSANRGKDDTERWYCMWDMIFPGERRPLLPYLGVGRQELLPLLRSFWNQRHQDIIHNIPQGSSQYKLQPEIIQTVMEAIFDKFEAESLLWDSYPNEHADDESSGTSNTRAQSLEVSNDIPTAELPLQQNIADLWTSFGPMGYQSGPEFDYPLEYMTPSDLDRYLGTEPSTDLSL
ncbi:hypothetical protein F4814DRAFT_412547 [Daldinia grandis]|nr:hypothetical protein F4814DRAFT_412547 [Daldinia grandis]